MKRLFLVFLTALVAVMVSGCEAKPSLKVFIWGEYIDEDLVRDFEDAYDVNVDLIIFESNEAAVTQIKDSSFDIIVPSDYAIEELAVGGYLETIDWTKLTDFSQDDLSADYLNLLTQIEDFSILDYAVPYFWGNIGLIYNKEVVSAQEVEAAGWDMLQRQDLNVMIYDISRDAMMIASRALYGQTFNFNQITDAELAAAETWLTNAIGNNTRFYTTEIYDVFLKPNPSIDVAHAFSGEAIYLLPDNDHLGWYVPTSGTNVWMDMLAIPKAANEKELAYTFINFMMEKEHAIQNATTVGYTSPRADVVTYIVENGIYGPEYEVEIRPYDHMYRYDLDLKLKIETIWSRIRATN